MFYIIATFFLGLFYTLYDDSTITVGSVILQTLLLITAVWGVILSLQYLGIVVVLNYATFT